MKRALWSLVKNPPSAKKRCCGSDIAVAHRPQHRRHRIECLVRQRLQRADIEIAAAIVLECRQRGMFAEHVRRRVEIERRAEAEPLRDFADDPPVGLGLARRGSRNARCREMRRSELVTVPDFSPQACAGSSTCAPELTVSLERTFSEITNSSSFFSAARAASASGSDTAGLVPITHNALISPRAIASNIWTAFSPSWVAMRGAFQNRRTRSMSGGVNPIWAASWLARPPTSRPPIALGCPVSENGDAPGCRSVPWRDGN